MRVANTNLRLSTSSALGPPWSSESEPRCAPLSSSHASVTGGKRLRKSEARGAERGADRAGPFSQGAPSRPHRTCAPVYLGDGAPLGGPEPPDSKTRCGRRVSQEMATSPRTTPQG